MSNAPTMPIVRDEYGMTAEDWQRLRSKTDAEIMAAALADPDAQPIPPERLAKMGRSQAKVVRHKLKMSREDFAATYGIPLDTLLAWERLETKPSAAESAYLTLIEREPERAKLVPA